MKALWCFAAALFGICVSAGATNGFYLEYWGNITGVNVSALTNSVTYPDSPDSDEVVEGKFETDSNIGDYYGQRARAILTPTISGAYTFYIASDNDGELWFGLDGTPSSRQLIAYQLNCYVASEVWTTYASQTSASITLTAGQEYYIEALHKEHDGGDNLAVGWKIPGSSSIEVIPASVLTPYMDAPVFTVNPQRINVDKQWAGIKEITFSCAVSRSSGVTFQWMESGVDIEGATSPSYTFIATAERAGHAFACRATNAGGSVVSASATYLLMNDTVAPSFTGWSILTDRRTLILSFSEPLGATATNVATYAISDVVINSARFVNGSKSVALSLGEPITDGVAKAMSFTVFDCATPSNTLTVASQSFTPTVLSALPDKFVYGDFEPPGPSSRRSGVAITEINAVPAVRADGLDTRFIELYNSNPFIQDISGYTISGSVSYTFPTNTIMAANAYIVLAPSPSAIKSVYGVTAVQCTVNDLFTVPGEITLKDEIGAWVNTVNYKDVAPWPVAANGSGHTLVLARPSYGEREGSSWERSAVLGGSPGRAEPARPMLYRGLLFNEVRPHGTDGTGFIEFINISDTAVSIGGCVLKALASTNITLAACIVPAHGCRALTEAELGLRVNGAGDELRLFAPAASGGYIVDAVRTPAVEDGVAYGRFPDGGPLWSRLSAATPGARNLARAQSPVVLNEIMYHPVSEKKDDEYIEIHNVSGEAVNLKNWSIEGGATFSFKNIDIAAGGYIIIPKNRAALAALYPDEADKMTSEGYSGALANGSDTIRLCRELPVVDTATGVASDQPVCVEEVTYRDGGEWGDLADGGGSSLERVDPYSDARLARSWAASDETQKSGWVTLEHTGAIEYGMIYERNGGVVSNTYSKPVEVHLGMQGTGECLIDSVVVKAAGGDNLVENSSFESANTTWRFLGTHDGSAIESCANSPDGSKVLHVRATDRVHTGMNMIRGTLSYALPMSGTGTIGLRVRWLGGCPQFLARVRGNWIEACGDILTTHALGTPGESNSRAVSNGAPSICGVLHDPLLPRDGEAVTVYARVDDPDGLLGANLIWHVDGAAATNTVAMTPCEGGYLKGVIPAGQASSSLIGFRVQAQDLTDAVNGSYFPSGGRECLVRFGEPIVSHTMGVYRFWCSTPNYTKWGKRVSGSNSPIDISFLYGTNRICYQAGIQYGGSPYHSGYAKPFDNGYIDYKISFAKDDTFLDDDGLVLATLGNLGNDHIAVREQFCYSLARAAKIPNMYRRYVHLYANGTEQNGEHIIEDTEKPNGNLLEHWFPDDPDGDLFKIDDWFEYALDLSGFATITATLQQFLSADDGQYKLARYRWNWLKRAAENNGINDYTNFFGLVTALNQTDSTLYTKLTDACIDRHGAIGVEAVNHFIINWDSYGVSRGKNMYLYQGAKGWSFIAWDLDMNFGLTAYGRHGSKANELVSSINPSDTTGSFYCTDAILKRWLATPSVTREWMRAMKRIADAATPKSEQWTEAASKYSALIADGAALYNSGSFTSFQADVETRRTNVVAQMTALDASTFSMIDPAGTSVTLPSNVYTVRGIAPFAVASISVNGTAANVTWTSATNWSFCIVFSSATLPVVINALDEDGKVLYTKTITFNYVGGALDSPDSCLQISEIMYNPKQTGGGYIEVSNFSTNTVVDLSGLYLDDAVSFSFPNGLSLPPQSCVVVAEDEKVFASLYGTAAATLVAGTYTGTLPIAGRIRLRRPANAAEWEDPVIDEVSYGTAAGTAATDQGVALQLAHPLADSDQPANWYASTNGASQVLQQLIPYAQIWKYMNTYLSGEDWKVPLFDDSAWSQGVAPLGHDPDFTGSGFFGTDFGAVTSGLVTYHFRTAFTFDGNPMSVRLLLTYILDDGAVFYLNGVEVARSSLMPVGTITTDTTTTTFRPQAEEGTAEGPFTISAANLVKGTNVFAVEVHQNVGTSSDVVFGMTLVATNLTGAAATPGALNGVDSLVPIVPAVMINEIGSADTTPWVELYNASTGAVNLAGWKLGGFDLEGSIAVGGFFVATNAAFSGTSGTLYLYDGELCADAVTYSGVSAAMTFGSYPDGSMSVRHLLYPATPGAANHSERPATRVVINEFMAQNDLFTNPLTGEKDDWFELYNDGTDSVSLEGWVVTDTLKSDNPPVPNTKKSKALTIPAGVTLKPGEAIRIWTGADNATALAFDRDNLQAPFGLNKSADQICLFTPTLELADRIQYSTEQSGTASLGRWVNGATGAWMTLNLPTPGEPNRPPKFTARILSAATAAQIREQELWCVTNTLTVAKPAGFTFKLVPVDETVLPDGLSMNSSTGVITWTPSEAQGPGYYSFMLCGVESGTTLDVVPLTVSVLETVNAPILAPLTNIFVNEGETITFTVSASRQEEIPARELATNLRLVMGSAMSNAVFDAATGLFTWKTAEIDGPGTYTVTAIAEDASDPTACTSTNITLTVNEVPSDFTYDSPLKFYLWKGEAFDIVLKFTDLDLPPNTLSHYLLSGPAGLTLEQTTGRLQWTPSSTQTGTFTMRFRSYDGTGFAHTYSVTFYVDTATLAVGGCVPSGTGGAVLSWVAKPDTTYTFEWSPSVEAPVWTEIPNLSVTGKTGTLTCTLDPVALGLPVNRAFFRIRQTR